MFCFCFFKSWTCLLKEKSAYCSRNFLKFFSARVPLDIATGAAFREVTREIQPSLFSDFICTVVCAPCPSRKNLFTSCCVFRNCKEENLWQDDSGCSSFLLYYKNAFYYDRFLLLIFHLYDLLLSTGCVVGKLPNQNTGSCF